MVQVTFWVSEECAQALKVLAALGNISRSALLRRWIKEKLEEKELVND